MRFVQWLNAWVHLRDAPVVVSVLPESLHLWPPRTADSPQPRNGGNRTETFPSCSKYLIQAMPGPDTAPTLRAVMSETISVDESRVPRDTCTNWLPGTSSGGTRRIYAAEPTGLQTGHRAHTRLPYSQPASRHPDLFVSTIDDTTYGNSPLELKEVRTTEAGGPAVPLPGARFALSISQVVVVQSSRWREHHSVLAGRTQ